MMWPTPWELPFAASSPSDNRMKLSATSDVAERLLSCGIYTSSIPASDAGYSGESEIKQSKRA
jgi:hypothetical protein